MKVVLLCGGAGTRFQNIYPKPLNLIHGIPMVYHVLSTLNLKELTVFYHVSLHDYDLCGYLKHSFPSIKFTFISIDFQTRGAAETVYLGLKKLKDIDTSEQIVFLDNDNIYNDLDLDTLPKGSFVLYNKNPTEYHHYSFVKLIDNRVIDIQERNPISNMICMGCYGFESIKTCITYCKKIILDTHDTEPYLSLVINSMIKDGLSINGHYLPNVFSIGTPNDIQRNIHRLSFKKLRIVFDLDNTLVSYPTEQKNYNSVQKRKPMLDWIKFLKKQGHEIIIYTARHMVTCQNNVGKVIKTIAKSTIDILNEFEIEYDELYFGKPYGDMYIDDKGFNCFDIHLMEKLGFYEYQNTFLKIESKSNQYHTVQRIDPYKIKKIGLNLKGEIFYYQFLQHHLNLQSFFPKFYTYENDTSIILEYIHGTSVSNIYYEGLFSPLLLLKLLKTVHQFHSHIVSDNIIHSKEDIYHHYMDKFEERSLKKQCYPFEDVELVYTTIQKQMQEFLEKDIPLNPLIHGDLWFSNIMYYKSNFKWFDMRGIFNKIESIQGHVLYDYAKLYQSIIGLDAIILYDSHISSDIQKPTEDLFWTFLLEHNILPNNDPILLKRLTGYLIYNSFYFYNSEFESSKKEKIWKLVHNCIFL